MIPTQIFYLKFQILREILYIIYAGKLIRFYKFIIRTLNVVAKIRQLPCRTAAVSSAMYVYQMQSITVPYSPVAVIFCPQTDTVFGKSRPMLQAKKTSVHWIIFTASVATI